MSLLKNFHLKSVRLSRRRSFDQAGAVLVESGLSIATVSLSAILGITVMMGAFANVVQENRTDIARATGVSESCLSGGSEEGTCDPTNPSAAAGVAGVGGFEE
ncbi:MAG: hypothetical protein KDD70_04215 [Bdellovibrionales bacterium]|nr:hypothetical protein [Bdellovibrionales bacterium]